MSENQPPKDWRWCHKDEKCTHCEFWKKLTAPRKEIGDSDE